MYGMKILKIGLNFNNKINVTNRPSTRGHISNNNELK